MLAIETDYPYIGKSPSDLEISANIIAEYKGLEINVVYEETLENLKRVFGQLTS